MKQLLLLPLLTLPAEPMRPIDPHALDYAQAWVSCMWHRPDGMPTPKQSRRELWRKIGDCEALDEARDIPVDIFPDVTQIR